MGNTPILTQIALETQPLPELAEARWPEVAESGSCALSLLIPARSAESTLERTVREAHRALKKALSPSEPPGESFEIVVIPNPAPGDASDRTEEIARSLAREFPEVKVAPHELPPGKGAALRTGYLASTGRAIFFTDADLPYDLRFVPEAIEKLSRGADLVTGNRRMPSSEFDVPVSLLPLAYGRHRLGLLFNRAVQLFLPIRTTDTQAGIKALSRRLADRAFRRQRCPGFFFDLEIFLSAREAGFLHEEIPVTLRLNSEKSTIRLMKEAILTLFWIREIRAHFLKGHYR